MSSKSSREIGREVSRDVSDWPACQNTARVKASPSRRYKQKEGLPLMPNKPSKNQHTSSTYHNVSLTSYW